MVAGLKTGHTRRHLAGAAVVVAVTVLHACVAEQWGEHAADLSLNSRMPPRLQVAYVREMAIAPPVVAAPPPAAPRVRRLAERSAPVAGLPASAPIPSSEPAEAPELIPPLAVAEAPVAPAAEAASAPAEAPFEWPASTRLRYVLTGNYRGEVHGQAQVEWIRAGDRYQVHLDVSVGPSFAPFMSRRMSSDGEITPDGLAPRRYDQETRFAFQEPYRATVGFEGDTVVLSNGQRREAGAGVQDTASQFVQLSWMFASGRAELRTGALVVLPLAMPRNVSAWAYDVLEEETLYTPFGPIEAFHLKPRREPRAGGDLVTEIWIAPRLRHLPVRFRIRQDADTYVDLMLDRRPEMAAP